VASLFLSLIGFYLVAGSVRRDAERGVGAILAATPLPSWAYLLGKLLAHAVYLHVIAGMALVSGVLAFLHHGEGPLRPLAFLLPFLLLLTPCLAFVAGLAVLFDVTPGLRGRGGLVVYFFTWAFAFMIAPGALGGMMGHQRVERYPSYDPAGLVAFVKGLQDVLPETIGGISIGIEYHTGPVSRVRFPGMPLSGSLIGSRLLSLAWAGAPLGLALLFFDRFDPGRRRLRLRRPRPEPTIAPAALGPLRWPPPADPRPTLAGAVVAEARLIWKAAGGLRFALLAAALGTLLPGEASRGPIALFLLLLVPVLSEVAARERLAGAEGLVFSQPAVPASIVGWKAAAAALFVLGLGAPALLAALLRSPLHALTLGCGLLFLASFAVAAGWLTGGGKLFSLIATAAWYATVQGATAFDFTGAFAKQPDLSVALAWLGPSLLLLGLAALQERRSLA
jgi:hypothetical protein